MTDRRLVVSSLLILLAIGTALRVHRASRLPCISRDGVLFVEFAKQIARAPAFYMREQKKQPGFSVLLLGAHATMGGVMGGPPPMAWQRCGQILAILGGAAGIVLSYLLTAAIFDRRTGLLAAVLAAFWPQHVELSADVLSDTPHLALYLGAILLGLAGLRRGGLGWFAGCGATAGAAYLLRQEAFGIPLAVGATLVLIGWKGMPRRRMAVRLATLGVSFVLPIVPYAAATRAVMHNKSILDLLFGTKEAAASVRPAVPGHEARAYASPPTAEMAGVVTWRNAVRTMVYHWGRSGRLVISTLGLIGFLWWRIPAARRDGRLLLAWAAGLQVFACYLRALSHDGVISHRYILIPAALTIPWAAATLRWMLDWAVWLQQTLFDDLSFVTSRRRWAQSAVWLAALAPMLHYCLRPGSEDDRLLREAGFWLADHAGPSDRLLAQHKVSPVWFYADVERLWPRADSAAAMLESPEYHASTWLADWVDTRRQAGGPERLLDVSREDAAFLDGVRERLHGVEPEAWWRRSDGNEVRLYRMRK